MTLPDDIRREVGQLLWAIHDGVATEQQIQHLEQLGREHPEIRQIYAQFTVMCGLMHWEEGQHAANQSDQTSPANTSNSPPPPGLPLIVIDPTKHNGMQPAAWLAPGGTLFSYAASALIVALGLLLGWNYYFSAPQQAPAPPLAQHAKPGKKLPPETPLTFVGRITGMIDCRWTNPRNQAIEGASLSVGEKIELAAGLLEVTYHSGAKVILEGPCSYSIDSRQGGYLAVGKVTANVSKTMEGVGGEARKETSSTPDRDSAAPVAPPAPLFAIRTPTALVTDLGTEFAVEVDPSGNSQTHVFRGTVEVVRILGNRPAGSPVSLRDNQSARVEVGSTRPVVVVRDESFKNRFPRALPRRARLVLFNTGVNLNDGDQDPHWQLVARSDEPRFEPRPTYVIQPSMFTLPSDPANIRRIAHLANERKRSQWISPDVNGGDLPGSAVYTFRTSFDLSGFLPRTAVLHGRFLADNHVKAIRLNGHELTVPDHPHNAPFSTWHSFLATSGFVEGNNLLEVEVTNLELADPPDAKSKIMLRIELEGSAVRQWQSPKPNESTSNPPKTSEGR